MSKFVENRKVLYVDDDDASCSAFRLSMSDQNAGVYTLIDSSMIGDFLKSNGPFAVVLSDQLMPHRNGVEVLHEVMRTSPDTMRVLVTGYADMDAIKGAINEGGVTHYVSKPWNDAELSSLINDLVKRYNVAMERQSLLSDLAVRNKVLQLSLQGTASGIVTLLSDLIDAAGKDVASQNFRIKKLGAAILTMMPGLSGKESWEISRALELFNLGLALLPPFIQLRIINEGMGVIREIPLAKNHHLNAAKMLSEIPEFEGVAKIILLMKKDFDGVGAPQSDRTRGKNLPLGSRILRILLDLEEQSPARFRGRQVLERMMKKPGVYDTELVGMLLGKEQIKRREKQSPNVPIYELGSDTAKVEDWDAHAGQLMRQVNSSGTVREIHGQQRELIKDVSG